MSNDSIPGNKSQNNTSDYESRFVKGYRPAKKVVYSHKLTDEQKANFAGLQTFCSKLYYQLRINFVQECGIDFVACFSMRGGRLRTEFFTNILPAEEHFRADLEKEAEKLWPGNGKNEKNLRKEYVNDNFKYGARRQEYVDTYLMKSDEAFVSFVPKFDELMSEAFRFFDEGTPMKEARKALFPERAERKALQRKRKERRIQRRNRKSEQQKETQTDTQMASKKSSDTIQEDADGDASSSLKELCNNFNLKKGGALLDSLVSPA